MRTLSVISLSLILSTGAAFGQTVSHGTDARALFQQGMNAMVGSGASRRTANAVDYLRRSADLGYAPAQVALGYLYETGRDTTTDPRQAFDWYSKAGSQDDPLGEWLAGRMIFAGSVPPRDLNQAAKWFESASSHADPFGAYLLGRVALERSNYQEAAAQFRKSAELGLPQAQLHLALLLRQGQGVRLDRFEAYVWLLTSRENGMRVNEADLQSLEADLGATQVERAKSKARELQTSATRSVAGHGCTGWPGEFDDIPAPPPPDLQRFCR